MAPEPPNSTSQLLTTKEFCLIYNIDKSTLRKRIKLGQIEAYRKPAEKGRGGKPQIFVKDPGWDKVIIPEHVRTGAKAKEHGRTGIYIYRGVDAAIFLGVTPRTVRRWAAQGKIGFAKVGLDSSRNRKYCIEDIRKMIVLKQSEGRCKNPTREAKHKAVMDWGYKQLGIEPPTA
jgi:hypothetical protein